jgi:apolipoprotein D and lipocalin family protein
MTLIFPQRSLPPSSTPARGLMRWGLMFALLFISGALEATSTPNQPVPSMDLQRYMGQWHEIAHLPLFFQRKCIGPITATSVLAGSAEIRLHSTCPTRNGTKTVDVIITPKPDQPAAFKIRLVPAWLSWLPYAWFEYWVVDIDPNYRWAVIGGPDAKHMWILSRDRGMSHALYQRLVQRARDRGYPVDELMIVAPIEGR